MNEWFKLWSSYFAQPILPGWFNNRTDINIKGSPELEGRIVTEVASYGSQLGILIDTVRFLAQRAGLEQAPELVKLVTLDQEVEEAKARGREELERAARASLARLAKVDPAAARRVAREVT